MPNYRHTHDPEGSFFLTVVTYHRLPVFADRFAQRLLGRALRKCQHDWPFEINAIVLLPDHLHTIWTLPHGDHRIGARWSIIKNGFASRYRAVDEHETEFVRDHQETGHLDVWEPQFREYVLEDISDFEAHFDYIHYNPVKHGYVKCPKSWSASSFHRWVKEGVYEEDWACGEHEIPDFSQIEATCGEPE